MGRNRVRSGALIGIVVLLALSAATWFLLLSPRMSTAAEISARAEQVSMSNLTLRNRFNQTFQDAQKAPEAAAEAQRLFSAMPQQADLPKVLQQITDAAAAAGLTGPAVQVITASVPVAVGLRGADEGPVSAAAKGAGVKLATMTVGMTVTGDRARLTTLLTNLQGLDRKLLITAMHLTDPGEGNPSAMQVSGSMFLLQSELPDLVASVDRLLREAEANAGALPAPAPATPPSSSASPEATG
jgi:hypothetical protein